MNQNSLIDSLNKTYNETLTLTRDLEDLMRVLRKHDIRNISDLTELIRNHYEVKHEVKKEPLDNDPGAYEMVN